MPRPVFPSLVATLNAQYNMESTINEANVATIFSDVVLEPLAVPVNVLNKTTKASIPVGTQKM